MIPECPRAGESRSRAWVQRGPAPELRQDRSVSGLLSEINTIIHTEAFTDYYTIIPGKELGR